MKVSIDIIRKRHDAMEDKWVDLPEGKDLMVLDVLGMIKEEDATVTYDVRVVREYVDLTV